MRQVLGWGVVAFLCCAAAAAGEQGPQASLQEAQAAYDEAIKLQDAGKYSEAQAQAEQALALREAQLGGTPPDVARCLNLLGRLHRIQGNFDRAEPLLQRGLAIREAALGSKHPDVADSLNNLGLLYDDQAKYSQAEPLYQRALAIREAALGKNHPTVGSQLNNLANLYLAQGLYARAEPLYLRALAIKEAAVGKNHPTVASSLNNLASLYQEQGRYSEAEALHQRALAIREAALGPNHPMVAQSLNNLAIVYRTAGLYARAEPLLERALAIWETVHGKNHPDVADALHNLAHVYEQQGLYGQAEPLFQRALAIQEAVLGPSHPHVADSLTNLASLYMVQGLYRRAEPLFLRSIAILEAAQGGTNPALGRALNNLANLSMRQGLYDRAELLYQRAFAIDEANFGGQHPGVASSLYNLGLLYMAQGKFSQAEPLLVRALAIREATLSKQHPHLADSLMGLGELSWNQGKYSQAEPLMARALAISEAALGKNHPNVAQDLNSRALLRLAQNRLAEAVPLFARSFAMSERRLRQEALGFSDANMASFLQMLRLDEQRLYALLRAYPGNAQVRRLALSAALLLKGRSIEETAGISRAVYRSLGVEDRDIFEQLRALRTQLAQLSLQGPGSLPAGTYPQKLQALAEQGDALESTLARRSAPLRVLSALPSPDEIASRVAAALPPGSALVEFVTYLDRPLVPGPDASAPQLRYLAMVLFPDNSIRTADLGLAEPINAAAIHLRDALSNRDAAFEAHAQALYRLVFQPLLPLLGKTRRLFLAPDGQLGLVPFAALQDGQQFLVETYDFTYVTSGKELLPRTGKTEPASSVAVLADPDFSAPVPEPASGMAAAPAPAERSASAGRFEALLREDGAHRDWGLVPLPGTRQEAESIQRLLPQAQLFLGVEATKERLFHLPTPGILHLATHGFFLEDAAAPPSSRAMVHFGGMGEDPQALRPPDPLLRSGLLLAGANAPSSSDASSPRPPPESALVTALELAGLNLWGTQLVVLSACDTGRGYVELGQGVYGLRRAFIVAGAETVVMSLWKVNDDTTSQLMEVYYRNLLAGQGRASALREAMRELRATQLHPHYWAPFIVVGRDEPLRALAK